MKPEARHREAEALVVHAERSDVVEHAVELGVLSDPSTYAQLQGEAYRAWSSGTPLALTCALVGEQGSADAAVDALIGLCAVALRYPGAVASVRLSAPPSRCPWVRIAQQNRLLSAEDAFTASLVALQRRWRARFDALDPDAEDRLLGERLLRRLDDAPRRAVFDMLQQAWLSAPDGWPGGAPAKSDALARAEAILGERQRWLKAFRQHTYGGERRLVVIPTWQCELRCSYCFIPKQDGRVMPEATLERSIELLLATDRPDVLLQFFGGEAMLEWDKLQHAITYASRRAAEVGKRVRYLVSSNGWSLTPSKIAWLSDYPVRLELSLDGDSRTQNTYRVARKRSEDSYENGIARHAEAILSSGLEQYVIMVVHPLNVEAMAANFFHIADLGFHHIQINPMLGRIWTKDEMSSFARGLHAIGVELDARAARGEHIEFVNARHAPMPVRLNGEVTVDWDGTIYGGNAFLHETEHKHLFVLAHLDDLTNIDRYWIDATDNNFLLDWSYRPKITANNLEVGKIMASFCKHRRSKRGPVAAQATGRRSEQGSHP